MTMSRGELHELVDRLPEEQVPSGAVLLRELAGGADAPRRRPSWFGGLRAGPDFAERFEDILREELGRSA